MNRENFASNSKWEKQVGYSRVVKSANIIEVAGTTSTDGDKIIGVNDYFLQSKYILEKISQYLENAGSSLEDVVRTRIYVCDISKWEEVGRAHALFFKEIKPAATMVEVNKLIHPDLLVEIEVTAVCTTLVDK